jgi:phage terminase small subunit
MTKQRSSAAGSKPKAASPKKTGTKPVKAKGAKVVKSAHPDVKVFIEQYKIDFNGRRAAIAAGYSARSADSTASRLLRTDKVKREIEQHQADTVAVLKAETGITLERTLKEIARISFFDPRRLFDAKGDPLAITDLDDDTAAVIAGLDVLEEFDGSGKDRVFVGHVKKWKLADKKGALDMLMKHLGGYNADNKQAGEAAAAAMAGLAVRFVDAKS